MTQLHFHERGPGFRVRKAYASKGDDCTFSRFVKTKNKRERINEQGRLFGVMTRQVNPRLMSKPPMVEGRTFFRKSVKQPNAVPNLLVSAHSNVKIGRDIRKGKLFRGYYIYTLSLQERATCPRSCHHWATCYGNNMPYAKRIDHEGRDFLKKLDREIEHLLSIGNTRRGHSPKWPRKGVMIRLHALGDFYSSEYVAFWAGQLRKHERLAIYGYTARKQSDPIGSSIAGVKRRFGDRFSIRWSDGGLDADCTVSIETLGDCPPNAIVCPEQTGHSEACGKCGLCWNIKKNIAFLSH